MQIEVYLKSRQSLRSWLEKNHKKSSGIWLVYDKGESRTISPQDITKEALCLGWIDSKPGKVNATKAKIYLAPRNPKSNWSRVNESFARELEKAGLLHASGRAAITLAKKNNTWSALDEVENLTIPIDLKTELKKHKEAEKFFNAFPRSTKRAILEWILNAKRSETRASRIKETAKLANKNIRANQYR